MPMTEHYSATAPDRTAIDRWQGPLVLEFGTDWCGHCQAATGPLREAFAHHPEFPHLRVEDGSGRPLGRSFGIKLWPTIILLRDGVEQERLVRPRQAAPLLEAFARLAGG